MVILTPIKWSPTLRAIDVWVTIQRVQLVMRFVKPLTFLSVYAMHVTSPS